MYQKPFEQSLKKSAFITVIGLLLTFKISTIDNSFIKPNAVIFIDNYSDICLVIWQVQVTLITLIIAFTSIIVSKLDTIHFGMRATQILTLESTNHLKLNLVDAAFVSVLLNVCTYFSILMGSMTSTAVFGFIEILIVLRVIYLSLMVIFNNEYLNKIAKKFVDTILANALETKVQYDENMFPQHTEPQGKLINIVSAICSNISQNLQRGAPFNLNDRTDLDIIITVLDKTKESHPSIFNYCMDQLQILQEQLISAGVDSVSLDLTRWLLIYCADDCTYRPIATICDGYYNGKLGEHTFNKFIEFNCSQANQSLDEHFNTVLTLIKYIICHGDTVTFKRLIQATLKYPDYYRTLEIQKLMQSILGYSYYLIFKEPLFIDKCGIIIHSKVMHMVNALIMINGKEHKLTDIIKNNFFCVGIEYITSNNNASTDRHWEFFSLGYIKTLHLEKDIDEYAFFYLFSFYKGNRGHIASINLDKLIVLRKMMTTSGKINDSLSENYSKFCEWISFERADINSLLVQDIEIIIKIKFNERICQQREAYQIRREKINRVRNSILQISKESLLYCDSKVDNAILRFFDKIEDIHIFHNDIDPTSYAKIIVKEIKNELFELNKCKLISYSIKMNTNENTDNVNTFRSTIEKYSEIKVDTCVNETATEFFKYQNISEIDRNYLRDFDTDLTKIKNWDIGYYLLIYIDRKIFFPKFGIHEKICECFENLNNQEINKFILEKHKNGDKYFIPIDQDLTIPCTYEECFEYVKRSKIKFKFNFYIARSENLFGFYADDQ